MRSYQEDDGLQPALRNNSKVVEELVNWQTLQKSQGILIHGMYCTVILFYDQSNIHCILYFLFYGYHKCDKHTQYIILFVTKASFKMSTFSCEESIFT
jgi:hypothetical protein